MINADDRDRPARVADYTFSTKPRPPCEFIDLGSDPVAYSVGLRLQYAAHSARVRGLIVDSVYILEHTPVITLGRSARGAEHLLTGEAELTARGIDVIHADRGGDVTYHAPGQLVFYPILDLNSHGRDLHRYLRTLEQTIIDLLQGIGLKGGVIPGLTGVWVDDRKIAAIGIKVSRWVTMHGVALNVDLDLAPMRTDIVPCGIADHGVTSLAELGITIARAEVENRYMTAFLDNFGVGIQEVHGTPTEELLRLERALTPTA